MNARIRLGWPYKGLLFYNIQENLVNVRVGKEMYKRRVGSKYFKSEARCNGICLDIISSRYLNIYNVSVRFAVQVAMPNSVRGWVFQKFARS